MAEEKGPPKSLKTANFVWLCTLVTFDVVVLAVVIFPDIIGSVSVGNIALARGTSSVLLPIVPLLLTNTVSQLMKARLVFWRWRNPNPGSRAFSKYVHDDDRINEGRLRKNIGVFPTDPKKQNSLWYALYKKVQDEVGVMDAHKAFLMYRDMASLSVLLLVLTVVVMGLWQFDWREIGKTATVFLAQYLLTMVSARVAGERFVCTVLSIHSTRKIPNPK